MLSRATIIKSQDLYISCWAEGVDMHVRDKKVSTNYSLEIVLTKVFLAFTLVAWLVASWQTGSILWNRIQAGNITASLEQLLFIVIIQGLVYGNFVYQLTRIGYLRRRLEHVPVSAEEREALYDGDAPTLAILVPSYKEELQVVQRTLVSAALQDYPSRRVVLLIDNPPEPDNQFDQQALEAIRHLPEHLQVVFNKAAAPFVWANTEFLLREKMGDINILAEAETLAILYEKAVIWIESYAENFSCADSSDQLLLERVLKRAAYAHYKRASDLRLSADIMSAHRIKREFKRLAALFSVEFTSFERKRYVNLSHESNKAMNLNSYIRLFGRSWQAIKYPDGNYLEEVQHSPLALNVPNSDFLITLDADSILVPEYALVLVYEMLLPGNERLAVAQAPYNTITNPEGHLEHIAGATTDIQYLIHQGFTQYGATYWVGANALLRTVSLHDIKTTVNERGFEMPVFIQDRTVIEDTESSIDLMACGWKLYNYPERLAYSATPPDFGSLLIQRRRWANGGLIIMPKLIRYLLKSPSWKKMKEGFFRIHYLGSIAVVNAGLLILLGHSFEESSTGAWLPLTALPYFTLYARDLCYNGCRKRDLIGVYALNLLLLPVNLGGVLKSLQQAITRQRIPFGRTPKVSGRTATPALYLLMEYIMLIWWIAISGVTLAAEHYWSAFFCLVNALLLGYAIVRFIGIKESWEDIRLILPAKKIKPQKEIVAN